MILTVTLNAALDRTLVVPNISLGHQHRATDSLSLPGGKGVNVARALKRLHEPVIATGMAGGRIGAVITEELTAEGILNDFVRCHAESRTSIAIVDPLSGTQMEVNEYGPGVDATEIETLFEKLHYLSKAARLVVLAGSLPVGAPEDLYAVIIRELARLDRPAVIDVAGEPLRAALAAGPLLVSPNAREAEEVIGYEFAEESDQIGGATALMEMGAKNALIHSLTGCVGRFADGRTFQARIDAPIDVVSTIGSGDAFLAGFLSAWTIGESPETALRTAVACGMANATMLGAGMFDMGDIAAFANAVEVTQIA